MDESENEGRGLGTAALGWTGRGREISGPPLRADPYQEKWAFSFEVARLEEVAEKLTLGNQVRPQRLKANSKHALTAALEALRHPKSMHH